MNERLSRMDRYGQRKRIKPQQGGKSKSLPAHLPDLEEFEPEVMDVEKMPTRKELFPSQRLKWTRWFYNSLLYIFVIILIYLLWWGVSDSPWGDKYGL